MALIFDESYGQRLSEMKICRNHGSVYVVIWLACFGGSWRCPFVLCFCCIMSRVLSMCLFQSLQFIKGRWKQMDCAVFLSFLLRPWTRERHKKMYLRSWGRIYPLMRRSWICRNSCPINFLLLCVVLLRDNFLLTNLCVVWTTNPKHCSCYVMIPPYKNIQKKE